jgi:hypothetical protein
MFNLRLTLITNSFKKLKAKEDTEGLLRHETRHFAISSISSSVALPRADSDRMIAPQTRADPTIESTFPFSSTLWNSFLIMSMMLDI